MEQVLFVEYPKCSTCKKAKAWLDARGVGAGFVLVGFKEAAWEEALL